MADQHSAYTLGHKASQVQHHEWRTAENSAGHLLPHLKDAASRNPGLKFLDIGAGSGTITATFAKYMPQGHITATDISDEILQRAASFAEKQGVDNITFQKANIFELPFEDGAFDITHAHQVLVHLDEPVAGIKEMIRVTKKGGILALREADMEHMVIWPELPGVNDFHETLLSTWRASGGHPNGGRQLVSWSLQAGIPRADMTATMGTWCYSQEGDRRVWADSMMERIKHGQMRVKALEMKLRSEQDLDAMAKGWDDWARAEDAMMGLVNGELIIHIR